MEILVEKPTIEIIPPGYPIACLKEKNGSRKLMITLNVISLGNLVVAIEKVETPRPLIHQVYIHSLQTLGSDVGKVVIDNMVDGAFHSHVYIKTQNNQREAIATHVTDALVIAVIRDCPIFVTEEVFKKSDEELKNEANKSGLSDAEAMIILKNLDARKFTKN